MTPPKKPLVTELAVAFGVLGQDPAGLSFEDLKNMFIGERPNREDFEAFLRFIQSSEQKLFREFYVLGRKLADQIGVPASVEWYGVKRQLNSTNVSRDLRLNGPNWSVSVKDQSDVVVNSSPYNLFEAIPSGQVKVSRKSENWFEVAAPQAYSDLVEQTVDLAVRMGKADEGEREDLRRNPRLMQVRGFWDDKRFARAFENTCGDAYRQMCRAAADYSAQRFNENLGRLDNRQRASVFRGLLGQFFRVNGEQYLFVGIDGGKKVILRIPSIDDLHKHWKIVGIEAIPRREAGQSEVEFRVEMKGPSEKHALRFRAEIRWSHGKFCGNPEAKLYKEFTWHEVPFFETLIAED